MNEPRSPITCPVCMKPAQAISFEIVRTVQGTELWERYLHPTGVCGRARAAESVASEV